MKKVFYMWLLITGILWLNWIIGRMQKKDRMAFAQKTIIAILEER